MGAGGAGRCDEPRREGSGRQGDRDGGCGDYGKISGKAWGEGAGGVFVGRDGGEGAGACGCDRGSYGDWIVAAREPASDSGYGSWIGYGVYYESEGGGRSCQTRK